MLARRIAVLLLAAASLMSAAYDGSEAEYVGGTIASLNGHAGGKLRITDEIFLEFRTKGQQLHVAYDKINLIEYGQNVNRRYVMAVLISPLFLLSKSKQHFLTVGYTDSQGRQQAMVFRLQKGKVRAVLVALEARTGLKVQFQDDEARKASKG